MVQNYGRLLTKKLEKVMKLVSLFATLKVASFVGIKNLENFESLTKIYGILNPRNNIYFFACKVK